MFFSIHWDVGTRNTDRCMAIGSDYCHPPSADVRKPVCMSICRGGHLLMVDNVDILSMFRR